MSRSATHSALAALSVVALLTGVSQSADSATHATNALAQPTAAERALRRLPAKRWDGPLRTHTTAPLHMLRPTPTTLTPPGNRDVRATRMDADVTWGNIWAYAPNLYRFDGEWVWVRLSAEQQFGRASLRLTATAIDRSGGALDPVIEAFHRRIGQKGGSRTEFPRGEASVWASAEEAAFSLKGSARRLGDTSLAFAWTLAAPTGSRPGVSTELLVTFPTGDPDELTGLGSALYGAGLLAEQPLGRSGLSIYAGLLASHTAADSLAGMKLLQHAVSGTLGIEYAWNPRWSAMLQYLGDSSAAKNAGEMSTSMHELAVGIRRRGAGRTTVEAGIVENLARYGNSADIELHAGLRYAF